MDRKQIVQNLVASEYRLHNHSSFIPATLDELARRRALIGTNPNGDKQTTRKTKGTHSDRPANEAAQRVDLADKEKRIYEAVRLVGKSIDHLDRVIRNAIGHEPAADSEQRCPGYPVGITCGDLIGYRISEAGIIHLRSDGLCNRCGIANEHDDRAASKALSARRAHHVGTNRR